VILSGDYIHHRRQMFDPVAIKYNRGAMKKVADLFKKYLPTMPVYWTVGNYDSLPVRFFEFLIFI
jgi:hypothetical protein